MVAHAARSPFARRPSASSAAAGGNATRSGRPTGALLWLTPKQSNAAMGTGVEGGHDYGGRPVLGIRTSPEGGPWIRGPSGLPHPPDGPTIGQPRPRVPPT